MNRMNKFYNPKLYKAPPTTPAPEMFVQINAHKNTGKADPGPPPETFGAYGKKSEESNGVVAMMDTLIKDLDREMQEAQVEEEDAQKEYEQLMSDSAAKRAEDSKALTEKEKAKADTEAMVVSDTELKKETTGQYLAAGEFL